MADTIYTRLSEYIEEEVFEHVKKQPDNITCAECGNALQKEVRVDNYGDLDIEVTPCEVCMDKYAATQVQEVLDKRFGGLAARLEDGQTLNNTEQEFVDVEVAKRI